MVTAAIASNAQNNDRTHTRIIEYTQDKLYKAESIINDKLDKAENIINEKLDSKDSLYVTPNAYNMTIMTQYSYAYEYYRFTSKDNSQSISLRPDNGNKVGLYIGWRWIFLGWSFDMTKNDAKSDINLSFYTAKIGIDLLYRKRDKGFNLSDTKGFVNEYGHKIRNYDNSFDGFSTKQKGISLYYIFNNKRFSYPAAYSQTTNQRISAGSFILGLTYSEQTFGFNYSKMDPMLQNSLKDELKFDKVKYKDFSINFGYSYNWVFAKNCLANLSLTPGVGYKNSSLKINDSKEFISNINFDLITRAAVVYNNSKYYIGASFVSHTYSYRKSKLSVVNGFGTINVYAGFNFWKKKPKTKKD
ncbi:MAG: DUF4421 domain-containing protein [Bacteroidales bacterium]|nr:DUF4421 domain-containing protein [Bacteroidales bacterium]